MKDFLTNKDLLELWENYDAFYVLNKFESEDNGTHGKEFKNLRKIFKDDHKSQNALTWIRAAYDSYYKNEYDSKDMETNPFYYLQCKINELEERK